MQASRKKRKKKKKNKKIKISARIHCTMYSCLERICRLIENTNTTDNHQFSGMPLNLFEYQAQTDVQNTSPLAERMRPKCLEEFAGQAHVIGEGALICHAIKHDRIFSMILWGPPGCGKTTLARLIARESRSHFVHFSAVLSGVKEIRSVIEDARTQRQMFRKKTILFVDEIHRFNKAQQDAFLHQVESGMITLIGATTENPSFEVISPLLSRCRLITLKPLTEADISSIVDRALSEPDKGLGKLNIRLNSDARSLLIGCCEGDARMALNTLEIAASLTIDSVHSAPDHGILNIDIKDVENAIQKKALLYDKSGEEHFNLISAFHKSLRGSDPDGALYWLGRMLASGEDPFYIARRMVRFASEDIGLADPNALANAISAMESFKFLGPPEGELALCQAAVYLATAPKSNSIYKAYGKIRETIRRTGALPVPLHIRNAPTKLMQSAGYGKGYKYAHDFNDAYAAQEYLPEPLQGTAFYIPTERGYEKFIKQRLDTWSDFKKKDGDRKTS